MANMSFPHDEGREWLRREGRRVRSLEELAGDVSPRRYARVTFCDGTTAILSYYPDQAREGLSRFVRSTELLEGVGVRVPDVRSVDGERGFVLLEDLGIETLYDRRGRGWTHLEPYCEAALSHVHRIEGLDPGEVGRLNPPLDGPLLRRELQQTWDAFLAPRKLTGPEELAAALHRAFDRLCSELESQSPLPCHRDYMARNLVPLDDPGRSPEVAVLDHQDLRLGPPHYDLASLLNDSLFPPRAVCGRLLRQAAVSGESASYHRAAVQRTLKAVGTFAAFAHRGFDRHLRLIGPTLGRTLEHARHLEEFQPLLPRLRREWQGVLGDPAI